MEEERFGKTRPSQKHNALLLKSDLGQAKPAPYKVPDAVFGRSNVPDAEGAGDLLHSWKHDESKGLEKSTKQKQKSKSFLVQQQQQHLSDEIGHASRHNPTPQDKDEAFTFGMKSGQSTPMADVINWSGTKEYADKQLRRDHKIINKEKTVKEKQKVGGPNYMTKNMQVKKTVVAPPEEHKEPFKMKKFANVPSRVVTR
eukprot:GCRY01001682.1.p1 GENE.GCRY01001682.1~~GCRY01001682.1.p1  ORF type:complete len:199 (+),score=34.76 GCRY01001682.1:182-778(+)